MAVTPVYDLDVPLAHAAFFSHGERTLSVQPTLSGAAAKTTFYLSSWIDLEGGDYVLRVRAEQSSLWTTAPTKNNARTIFSSAKGAGSHEAYVNLPRGRQRIDIMLTNLSATTKEVSVTFSLWKQGRLAYASSGSTWVFDTAPIDDGGLPEIGDYRMSLPVFPVEPNWKNGIVERFVYSTEVMQSESAAELRRSLLIKPRRYFELSFARWAEIRSRIDTMLVGAGHNQLLLPLWHDQERISATLGASYSFSGDLAEREFTEGGLALVMGRRPEQFEVLVIETINTSTNVMTFASAPVGSWVAGSRLMPLVIARVEDGAQMQNLTDAAATAGIRFRIDDTQPSVFDPSWGSCAPIFPFNIDRGEPVPVSYFRPTAVRTETGSGPLDVYDNDQRAQITLQAGLTLITRQDVLTFKRFIDQARGRAQRFWMSTFHADVQAISATGEFLDIKSIGFADFHKTYQDIRGKLRFEFFTGSPLYRNILFVTRVSATVERLTLDAGLGVFDPTKVKRVSFIMPARFDQDAFDLVHLVDQQAAVRTSVVVRSMDLRDMPPLQCVLTSTLYPIEMIDGFNQSFGITGGTLNGAGAIDGFDQTFSIPSGTMDNPFLWTTSSKEGFDQTFSITDGSLAVSFGIASTTSPPDGMDSTFAIHGGSLRISLIQYDEPVDAFDQTFAITQGSLA